MAANTMTLLFTDLVGSTAMGDRLGDESAEAVRRTFFAIIEEAVEPTGGRIVKTLGDGHMVAFVSALDAVGCAIAIQAGIEAHNSDPDVEPLLVRVGINAGDVSVEGEDYFGTPVTIAKRLCDSAQGGQILVSGLVESLVGSRGSFSFRGMGQLELRGLSRPQVTSEVMWRGDVELLTAPIFTAGPASPASSVARRGLVLVAGLVAIGVVIGALVALGGGDGTPDSPGSVAPDAVTTDTVAGETILDVTGELPTLDSLTTHEFDGVEGDVVRVEATRRQQDVDLVIELRAPNGDLVAFDDDSGAGSEPLIAAATLPTTGEYSVVMRMFAPDNNGGYTLVVTKLAKPPAAVPDVWFGEIAVAGDSFVTDVELARGEKVDVVVSSESVNHADLYLELIGPDGVVGASDDDSGLYADPMISAFTASAPGIWTVRITNQEPEDLGAFRVELVRKSG